MPPKFVGRRGGARVAVGATHPAKLAAVAKKANAEGNNDSVLPRTSPSRGAKTIANARIHELASSQHERVPIASVASSSKRAKIDNTTPHDNPQAHFNHPNLVASLPVEEEKEKGGEDVPSFPPLWNAWCSACCRVVHYVGDGGVLEGKCCKCDNINPKRQDVMLDPDQVDELKKTPGLSLSVLMPGHNHFTHSHPQPEVPMSFPRGQGRKSPKEFQQVDLGKTSGLLDEDISFLSHDSNEDITIVETKTDLEVSKYSFFEWLEHYMEHVSIGQENRGMVELAKMVEAGTIVREMGTMTKERRESVFYEEYHMSLLSEIPDEMLADEATCHAMKTRFKGMRKGDMNANNLLHKYETEVTALKKFAYGFPGFGDLNKLPSWTPKLQHLRKPVVSQL
jgi:hypothetical protein